MKKGINHSSHRFQLFRAGISLAAISLIVPLVSCNRSQQSSSVASTQSEPVFTGEKGRVISFLKDADTTPDDDNYSLVVEQPMNGAIVTDTIMYSLENDLFYATSSILQVKNGIVTTTMGLVSWNWGEFMDGTFGGSIELNDGYDTYDALIGFSLTFYIYPDFEFKSYSLYRNEITSTESSLSPMISLAYDCVVRTINTLKKTLPSIGASSNLWTTSNERPKPVVKYTVTFDANGGSYNGPKSVEVEEGKTISKPTDPSKSHYEFLYWEYAGREWDFNKPVLSNMTLKALYKPVEYEITIDPNNGQSSYTVSATIGETLQLSVPTKTDYSFTGWFVDGNRASPFSGIVDESILGHRIVALYQLEESAAFNYVLSQLSGSATNAGSVASNPVTITKNDDMIKVRWNYVVSSKNPQSEYYVNLTIKPDGSIFGDAGHVATTWNGQPNSSAALLSGKYNLAGGSFIVTVGQFYVGYYDSNVVSYTSQVSSVTQKYLENLIAAHFGS